MCDVIRPSFARRPALDLELPDAEPVIRLFPGSARRREPVFTVHRLVLWLALAGYCAVLWGFAWLLGRS
jgi:hypothetical protein